MANSDDLSDVPNDVIQDAAVVPLNLLPQEAVAVLVAIPTQSVMCLTMIADVVPLHFHHHRPSSKSSIRKALAKQLRHLLAARCLASVPSANVARASLASAKAALLLRRRRESVALAASAASAAVAFLAAVTETDSAQVASVSLLAAAVSLDLLDPFHDRDNSHTVVRFLTPLKAPGLVLEPLLLTPIRTTRLADRVTS